LISVHVSAIDEIKKTKLVVCIDGPYFFFVSECEQGSWESGLSYECRSLLFKALHNLIERCLLSRDFIRLGKWFVQPYEGPRKNDYTMTHLSFSLAFFVHGESSVCASVDVRQHPPVRRLTRLHLQQAQSSTSGLKGNTTLFTLVCLVFALHTSSSCHKFFGLVFLILCRFQ
jgi:hypothetical protein